MRMVLALLSVIALLLATRRFYRSEDTGYDIGALFLLLIGIQLFVAAMLVHEHQQARGPRQSVKDASKQSNGQREE